MREENTIPEHWELKKLGEVCKLKNGYAFKSGSYKSTGIPVIRISDIRGGVVSCDKAIRIIENDDYESYLVKNNDILIAMSGATTGKFGIYKNTEKAYQNQRVGKLAILDKDILDNQFLFHQINSLKRIIEKEAYGGAQPNISSNRIEQMPFILPSLPEQQAIVFKIEELLSDLENGKQQLQTAQQQLKTYRQSLLKWAFEGKLTNNNIKDGELPKGWKVVELKNVTSILGDGLHGTPKYSDTGEYYFINGNNLCNGRIILKTETKRVSLEEYEKYKKPLNDNTILVSINGTLGNVAFYNNEKVILGKSACYFNVQHDVDKNYVRLLLTGQQFQNYAQNNATGSTIKNVSLKSMREFKFPLPSLEEQWQIVQELESKLTVCDKIEETISQSLQQAETLKQSILKTAFEGKLI